MCAACPAKYVARSNGLSCKPVQCSHLTCQHEEHSCHYSKSNAALRAFVGQYSHEASNCDNVASVHSIRVNHGGNACNRHNPLLNHVRPQCTEEELTMDEVPCANGHRCGMGVVSGDTDSCECAPLDPIDFIASPMD